MVRPGAYSSFPSMRSIPRDLSKRIQDWRDGYSEDVFRGRVGSGRSYVEADGKIWVIKYIPGKHLESFIENQAIWSSAVAGYTWGDGVYVTPLRYSLSGAIFGRVGVVGYIDQSDIRHVYDASHPDGISLYQEWIPYQEELFRDATTRVYAQIANRYLRNLFRHLYGIDLIFFNPDEFNKFYVDPDVHHWFTLSEWDTSSSSTFPVSKFGPSSLVRECRWVVRIEEEFTTEDYPSQSKRTEMFGKHISPVPPSADNRPDIESILRACHADQRNLRPNERPNIDYTYLVRISNATRSTA